MGLRDWLNRIETRERAAAVPEITDAPAAVGPTAEQIEIEAIVAAADVKLAGFVAEDEADRLAAREYVAPVRVVKYVSGLWLEVDSVPSPRAVEAYGAKPATIEVPLLGIAEVVAVPGSAPARCVPFQGYEGSYFGPRAEVQHAKRCNDPQPAYQGLVAIKMHSGTTYQAVCSRHVVDMLFAAVRNAWKTGSAPGGDDGRWNMAAALEIPERG